MGLKKYVAKRDFKMTAEPKGKIKTAHKKPIFVVQEHHASRLHWDFRLEAFGVLKSWAVPKEPAMDPSIKRLAVEVEDHPIEYAKFKGTIPKGQYGAGEVYTWDKGFWTPPENIAAALKKGHLDFELHGKKLKGRWTLIRIKSQEGKQPNWLLMKRSDSKKKSESSDYTAPRFVEPQLAELVTRPPEGHDWIHEIKFDGYRTFALINEENISLLTRTGLDWTEKYGPIKDEVKKLPTLNALLDGEIVWVDDQGQPNFQGLQTALQERQFHRMVYYVFDILHFEGKDIRALPLIERKKILESLIERSKSKQIIYSKHWVDNGLEIYQQSCKAGLEGIVSKMADQPYLSGRSSSWQKSKCSHRQEFVIGGYSESPVNRGFSALLMGVYEGNNFRYVGKVGTGYSSRTIGQLLSKMKSLEQENSPFDIGSPREKGAHWLKPKLVAEVEYKTITKEKLLRQASFKGLRQDKKPEVIHMETPKHTSQHMTISHPDRILYSTKKLTKLDVANYYAAVMPWIYPFVKERPLSVLRCQETATKNCYVQKHAAGKNIPGVHDKPFKYKDKKDSAIIIESPAELISLVQAGVIEFHSWQTDFLHISKPTQIVFDLDPDSEKMWPIVVETAHEIHEMLNHLDLKSFIKVTGGKGLHIHVPILPNYSWDNIKNFSKSLMKILEIRHPDRFTTNMIKSKRKNRIFLDYLRNGFGATAIVPYSVRARENPAIALPIEWSQLKESLSPDQFQLPEVLKLIKRRKDPWEGYWDVHQPIEILERESTGELLHQISRL